jgi:hypothetical protein
VGMEGRGIKHRLIYIYIYIKEPTSHKGKQIETIIAIKLTRTPENLLQKGIKNYENL